VAKGSGIAWTSGLSSTSCKVAGDGGITRCKVCPVGLPVALSSRARSDPVAVSTPSTLWSEGGFKRRDVYWRSSQRAMSSG